MSSVRSLTLADVALPWAGSARDALLVAGACLGTAIAAQAAVPVPWTQVPITGQTFAVLFAERGWDRHFATMLAAMLLGSAAILAFGLAGFGRFVPPGTLLAQGLLPFIPGDLIKSALAALAFPAAWRLLTRTRRV